MIESPPVAGYRLIIDLHGFHGPGAYSNIVTAQDAVGTHVWLDYGNTTIPAGFAIGSKGVITVSTAGPQGLSGSFDVDLLAGNNTTSHLSGSWSCTVATSF